MEDGRKRRLPEGAQGSIKRNFSRSGEVRTQMRDEDDDDNDEEEEDQETQQLIREKQRRPGKKTKEEIEEEVEQEHLSEASGDEEVGEKGKVKQRDRTRVHIAALKKQGINLDSDGEDHDDDDDDEGGIFREHLKASGGGRGMEDVDTSNPFHAGKVQTDYEAPSREQLETLFGKENDDTPVEEFSMGVRSSKYMYGRAGQVLEEDQDAKDAWLDEWADGTPKNDAPKGGEKNDALNAFNRISKKKPESKEPVRPIRRSKDPLQNLQIVLSHLQPGETILKALKRLGPSTGGPAAHNIKKKNVRTKPSDTAMQTESTTNATKNTGDTRSFEELTEAAQNLLEAGEIEIYSETFESVTRALEKLKAKKRQADEETAAKLAALNSKPQQIVLHWQYRWNPSDEQVHGPFVGAEMEEWKADGYFNDEVLVQRVGPGHPAHESQGWVSASSITSYTKAS